MKPTKANSRPWSVLTCSHIPYLRKACLNTNLYNIKIGFFRWRETKPATSLEKLCGCTRNLDQFFHFGRGYIYNQNMGNNIALGWFDLSDLWIVLPLQHGQHSSTLSYARLHLMYYLRVPGCFLALVFVHKCGHSV